MLSWTTLRHAAARHLLWLAAFAAAALLVVPKGLSLFALCLLLATLLAPGRLLGATRRNLSLMRWLLGLPALVLLVTTLSMAMSGQGMNVLDNPARLLLIPWCAALAYALSLPRTALWWGALAGHLVAFAIAVWQVAGGAERADASTNPIVFANAVLALLVLAVFCRPRGHSLPVTLVLAFVTALAVVTLVLSGSRGVLPGLGLVLLVGLVGGRARRRWLRLGVSAGMLVLLFSLLWTIPWLSAQTRLDNVHAELDGYAQGQVDTPVGARLALLSLAGDAFFDKPWTGVGIDRFGEEVDRLPHCAASARHLCDLNHAHNDVAQWAATMGVPGLAALLVIYAVPLAILVALVRRRGVPSVAGAGWAGAMLVAVYMLSGMTQSMFAHAMTTSAYAVFVGLLAGIAMREAEAPGRSPSPPDDGRP